MRILLYIALSVICVSLAACSGAQNDSKVDDQTTNSQNKSQDGISKQVKEAFNQKYPSHTDVKWNVDANGYLEADFEMDGEKYRADFDKSGKWIETENSIKFDDLPEVVQKVIKDEYEKDDIAEIESVDNSKKGKFFDIEFKQKGKNKDVEINGQGEVIN